MKEKTQNLGAVLAGSLLATSAFFAPEVMAALPTTVEVPLGDLVTNNSDATTLAKTVISWLINIVAFGLIAGAAIYWAWGSVNGLRKLQDEENYRNYTMGTWLQTNVIGLLTTGIAGVMGFYLYDFAKKLAGAT